MCLKAVEGKPIQAGTAALVIIVFLFSSLCPAAADQKAVVFASEEKFIIPQYNGSIVFATNGSCSSATLENDSWVFYDLAVSNSSGVGNLRFSAQSSNITIFSYYLGSLSQISSRFALISYFVQGVGTQTINLGLNASEPTDVSEWGVILPGGVFLSEGKDWHLEPDNTVVLNGLTGNVTVAYYRFDTEDSSNLPFYLQHSVALATVALVSVTVAVAGLIRYKVRRQAAGH